MKGKIGPVQLEILRRFQEPCCFMPSRSREPWPVMKSLAARGLLWCEKRGSEFWNPAKNRWDFHQEKWWAGLTTDGKKALSASAEKRNSE